MTKDDIENALLQAIHDPEVRTDAVGIVEGLIAKARSEEAVRLTEDHLFTMQGIEQAYIERERKLIPGVVGSCMVALGATELHLDPTDGDPLNGRTLVLTVDDNTLHYRIAEKAPNVLQ